MTIIQALSISLVRESDKMSVLKCWHFFCRTVVLYVQVLMGHSWRLNKIINNKRYKFIDNDQTISRQSCDRAESG